MATTVKEQLIQEIEDLPDKLQEKMLKMVHFKRKEILAPTKKDEEVCPEQ